VSEPNELPLEPRRVTRADAFPLAPRAATVTAVQLGGVRAQGNAASVVKSFGCSFVLGIGGWAYVIMLGNLTHTRGVPRSVELRKERVHAEAREELRRAEEAAREGVE